MIKNDKLLFQIFGSLKPKPKLNGLEWAKKYGYLSAENSAITGRFKPYKYQEALLLSGTDEDVAEIWHPKSARVGYTKILNMLVGYHIAEAPCPQLMFNPNDKKANEWSKKELKPLLRDMPIVGEKIVRSRQDDTVNFKVYPGGVFESRGGNAAANYAAATAKRVNLDEVDRFPDDVDGEGSPIELAIKRTATFWDSQAIFGSTPTITGISKIEEGFKKTDMCYFYVPCPYCDQFQIIDFKNIIWEKEFRQGVLTHLFQTAYLKCIHCEDKILHKSKKSITNQGEWRQTQKFFCCGEWQDPKENNNWDKVTDEKYIAEALCKTCNKTAEYNRNGRKKRGFHVWAGYSLSPDADWSNIAEVFVEAKDATSRNKMKVFRNVWLGESYEDKTIKLDGDDLYNQREDYTLVSNDAVVLLMTVDTQDTWLAYEIKEWKAGEISRGLVYGNILGDPMNKSVWDELKKISEQDFITEDGRIVKVFKVFIDLAGHKTDHVKNFVRGNQDRFVMLKGSSNEPKDNDARPIATLKMPKKGDLPIMWVATTKAKDTIFERLTLKKGDYGYMYYNMNFDLEWFAQLTAEKVVFKLSAKGYMERTYVKRRERNEAIDLEAYQLAAVRLLQDMGLIDLAIPDTE